MEPLNWQGRRLGNYRIVSELGRGGMSHVYKAARDDDQYYKEVAIKLLRPGLDTHSLLQRLRDERQMLPRLSHPNIAQLGKAHVMLANSPGDRPSLDDRRYARNFLQIGIEHLQALIGDPVIGQDAQRLTDQARQLLQDVS